MIDISLHLRVDATGAQVPETDMVRALRFAHKEIQHVIQEQWKALASAMSPPEAIFRRNIQYNILKKPPADPARSKNAPEEERLQEMLAAAMVIGLMDARAAFSSCIADKGARGVVENKARVMMLEQLTAMFSDLPRALCSTAVDSVMAQAFRENLLKSEVGVDVRRPDGRGVNEVRQITSHHDVLPLVHGSSFFQRGDTHVLAGVTLGPLADSRKIECMKGQGEITHNFFLHYNFPPYCTGDIGNLSSSNRRMIGHGNLAEKALRPVMPDVSEFPYTVRVLAECTSSSGSSSMASACAGSLALMDAGVSIKAAVAGMIWRRKQVV